MVAVQRTQPALAGSVALASAGAAVGPTNWPSRCN